MALLPPRSLDIAVALGSQRNDGAVDYLATGFLYGHPTGEVTDQGGRIATLFLVTNRHVIERIATPRMSVRLNSTIGTDARLYSVSIRQQDGSLSPGVYISSTHDLAAIRVVFDAPIHDAIGTPEVVIDTRAVDITRARELGISEGDGVFILGFPMGLAGEQRNYTIVRQGIIARIRDYLEGHTEEILIDASIYPGNSGGPVFTRPEKTALTGTTANQRSLFLGMVSRYIPYQDVAVSQQTGRLRVIFEENSGLGKVVPYDAIQRLVNGIANDSAELPLHVENSA